MIMMMIIMIIIDDYDVLVSRLVVTFSADCHHASPSVGKYWRNYLAVPSSDIWTATTLLKKSDSLVKPELSL